MHKKGNKTKNQKISDAQHRTEFLRKMGNSCKAIIGEDLFKLLPPNEFKKIFFYRARPITVVADVENPIPPRILAAIQRIVNFYIKTVTIPTELTQKSITLYDFYTTGATLFVYGCKLKDSDFKNAGKVKSLLSNGDLELTKHFNFTFDYLWDNLFPYLIRCTNSYWGRYYSYRLEIAATKDNSSFQYQIVVKQYVIEKGKFNISGNVRPVFRIGWTFNSDDFEWVFLLPQDLNLKNMPNDKEIPVYIQSHAIKRIFERIDCIHPSILIFSVYSSLRDCKSISLNGIFIIELKIFDVKVGYLSSVMIDGKLVIRTFLFLTFNGTPEGKRLENFIGLKELDTKYLKMDKLSTFMTSKLAEDEELRIIFKKAECLNLVELYDKLDKFSAVHPDHSPIEMLASYLKKGEETLSAAEKYQLIDD